VPASLDACFDRIGYAELANGYTRAHPQSHFKNRLLAARAGPGGERHTLLNHDDSRRRADGSVVKTALTTPEQLLEVLSKVYGLVFPAGTRFECPALSWA
jgi:N-hydroxyarylamine O-acetyltransferase